MPGLEPLAVSGGGDAERPDERAPHRLGRAVAAAPGDLLDPGAGVLKFPAGRLQPDPVDVPARRHAGLGGEAAGELPGRQARPGRPALGTDRSSAGPLGDPLLHLAQRRAPRQLSLQLGAELRLAARAAQEHHQVPGDVQRRLPADVLLDQRQGQVDARGDPCEVTTPPSRT